ncbi:alpha/beta hydrolase [Brachybacterium kimchii]|uniref:Alpha/beta hydrolase-fold protein n=1 Tax=Brachybacterium kimchii TaxID=2942909 RepID=A0ABY4N4M4_9MICO|nr:alpha/beta hydrolase-fold protein [Brachybacterium kimchii]UQN29507.1 alpha/beta hydrolase-fold protein [Brachybacterium kimchii]
MNAQEPALRPAGDAQRSELAALLSGPEWEPLPRPTDAPVQRVRVVRAEQHPAASAPGGAAVEVLAREDDRAIVRLQHRAPGARAVAAQINGWWHPDPPDGLDLISQGDGWFTGVLSVPGDLCATISFLEHQGDDGASAEPPWWSDGLKGKRTGAPSRPQARPSGSLVLDLVRDRVGDSHAPSSLPVHELATAAGEPRTRWCTIGVDRGNGEEGEDGEEGADGALPPSVLPLLVVTDGEAHLDRLDTPGVLAEAVRAGELPPLRAVFIDAWPERARDLGVPGGQAAWIADTLVPRLRPTPDPRRTVVTGSSFGGLTSLFALARAPHRIGAAIAQSVSLWRYPHLALAAPLRAALRSTAPGSVRIRLHAGHFEGTMGEAARELADAVSDGTGATIPVRMHRGGHDWAWWQPAMVEELAALLTPARP